MQQYLDKIASLTPEIRAIVCDKSTEAPHSGRYNKLVSQGSYLCRRCGWALFRANNQFSALCGWPSFDESLVGRVKEIPDSDGERIEIVCGRCDSHLGHVFGGENLTLKNTRYCVNSLALDFVNDDVVLDTEEVIVAGGCFWGVDYYLRHDPGVVAVEVGYCGGTMDHPTYDAVSSGQTGHYEAVRVIFDTKKTNCRKILQYFFEIHDSTQTNGQGPDIGSQYQSAVFCFNESQQVIVAELIQALKQNGYHAVTRSLPAQIFWSAEDYHQNYYTLRKSTPYCHLPISRFKQGI
jgi:peptide methionine sulfoxide reductase msrA/msrB